jgi:uroporphyrinogen decarboxylase
MTPRELVIKTLNHEPVTRVPRDLWLSESDDPARADEAAEIAMRFPSDIVSTPGALAGQHSRPAGKVKKRGEYADAWGCKWRVGADGAADELIFSPLSDTAKLSTFQPPAEVLDHARFAKANRLAAAENRFVLGWSEVRPLDRLRMLRGNDAALTDLARGTKEIRAVLAALHELNCKELERWASSEVDGVVFRDDFAGADGPLVSADMWRELLRPLYREYCKILHEHDKFVFFITQGDATELFGEILKTGIDAIHCQFHLMNFQRLVKRYRGRVTFWGRFDGGRLANPGKPEEFREIVMAYRRALDFGAGGVIAQCHWNHAARLHTVAAYFEHWLVPLPMHA